jgi:hypothetical protein
MNESAAWAVVVVATAAWVAACSGGRSIDGGGSGGEGGLGGATGTETFEITQRQPSSNDNGVWAFAPLEVEFSRPLDETTIASAVQLQARGETVPFTGSLDGTGRRLRLTLDAIPALPARVNISIGSALRSVDGVAFPGDSWAWDYPLWQAPSTPTPGPSSASGGLGLAVAGSREVLVAYPTSTALGIARLVGDGDSWTQLPEIRPVLEGASLQVVAALGSSSVAPTVVWLETASEQESVHVARFDGTAWQTLGGGPAATGASLRPQSRLVDGGAVVVAFQSALDEVTLLRAGGDAWSALGSTLKDSGLGEWTFALDDQGDPLVAYVNDGSQITVQRWQSGWTELGSIARQRQGAADLQLAWVDGHAVLAYLDGDEVSNHVQVARFDGGWRPLGAALDVDIDAEASSPRLLVDPRGSLVVSWRERYGSNDRLFVARQAGSDWQVQGASPGNASDGSHFVLASDVDGNVHLAWLASRANQAVLELRRFNGSPSLPLGLAQLGALGACRIPVDSASDFPRTLTATGCYEDVARQRLVAGAIPFSINSPLWSDGAGKKRYVLLPEQDGARGTVDYVSAGALGFPVGTIIVKEFSLERVVGDPTTKFPVETRFLVKRCEEGSCFPSWQGYSYEWNTAGTEANLLGALGDHSKEWAVTDGGVARVHVHLYPSRQECALCHNPTAGYVLGLQSKQLNKAHDYGHTVDNQLRAWVAAGLFGSSAPAQPAEQLSRLPKPADVGRSLEERSRSYFHSNCGHCHRAGGVNQAVDFRYEAPLSADNICNKLTPGDHTVEMEIWARDAARGNAQQMPPLATLLADERQLAITAAWIDGMGSCP